MSILKNDFLWGGAVAAHQLEGGWDQGGKGVSVAAQTSWIRMGLSIALTVAILVIFWESMFP